MSESTQIVRRLQKGEFRPAYSTDELMLGVCHIVRFKAPRASLAARRKPEPKQTSNPIDPVEVARMLREHRSNRMIAWSLGLSVVKLSVYISNNKELRDLSNSRQGCSVSIADRNFGTIKRMLLAGSSGEDIGLVAGLSASSTMRYINTVHELTKIYVERGKINGPKRASKERFVSIRAAIYRALKTRSLTDVSDSFGFRTAVLKRHIAEDEVKNGQ